jgi:hypothetical protein
MSYALGAWQVCDNTLTYPGSLCYCNHWTTPNLADQFGATKWQPPLRHTSPKEQYNMSDIANDATKPKARIVLELCENGSLVMESYRNGQRTRLMLNRGQEYWEILDELRMQQRAAESEADRQKERNEKKLRHRHYAVWTTAAEHQGVGFAKNVIKGEIPLGYGKYFAKEADKAPKAKSAKKALTPILGNIMLLDEEGE